jgi:hypothetical protein
MGKDLPESTRSGIKAFLEHYGELTPSSMSKFLGITEKEWYKKYWKIWKNKFTDKIN